jgi:chromosome segregation ATPase
MTDIPTDEEPMSNPALKSLEAKLTALVEQHRELKDRFAQAQEEIGRLKKAGSGAAGGGSGSSEEVTDLNHKLDMLLKEREDVRQKVENMIKALEDFEE